MGKTEAHIYNLEGNIKGKIDLPEVFETPIRYDVIKRAVLTIQSHRFQPQGRDPYAGKRTTAESMGVGHGIARIARLKDGRRAAFVPSAVGGKTTHPPRSEKKIRRKLPKKEMKLALKSAIAATASKEEVNRRGHFAEEVKELPLIVVDDLQSLKRTREVKEALLELGLWPDILRAKKGRKIRAGKGKMRGRKMKRTVGPLIVVAEDEGIGKAARNMPGVDVETVDSLNVELMAPGTHPGRLTIWTRSAIEQLKLLSGGVEA